MFKSTTTKKKEENAGSILDSVIGIFYCRNSFGRTMALGSTQFRGYFPRDKGSQCLGLTLLPPSYADCLKSANLKHLAPSVPVESCTKFALPFTFLCKSYHTQLHLRTLKFARAPYYY